MWASSATASTTRSLCTTPTSASRSTPPPTWPRTPPTSSCSRRTWRPRRRGGRGPAHLREHDQVRADGHLLELREHVQRRRRLALPQPALLPPSGGRNVLSDSRDFSGGEASCERGHAPASLRHLTLDDGFRRLALIEVRTHGAGRVRRCEYVARRAVLTEDRRAVCLRGAHAHRRVSARLSHGRAPCSTNLTAWLRRGFAGISPHKTNARPGVRRPDQSAAASWFGDLAKATSPRRRRSVIVRSVLEVAASQDREFRAIGTLNEGALHVQLKDWYRH